MIDRKIGQLSDSLQARLTPGVGQRHGRPTDASWVQRPKVPMSEETVRRLRHLADMTSSSERRISPMQVAAQILEVAVCELAGASARAPRERCGIDNQAEARRG